MPNFQIFEVQKKNEQKFLGNKTENNSPKNIKKSSKNNPCNNTAKLLQKDENNYFIKKEENINSIKACVNKKSIINNGLIDKDNVNIYKNYNVKNYNSNINIAKNIDVEEIMFYLKEKEGLSFLNYHYFLDIHCILGFNDFNEEQKIVQKKLNQFFGY